MKDPIYTTGNTQVHYRVMLPVFVPYQKTAGSKSMYVADVTMN